MNIQTISYEEALALGPERFVNEILFPTMRRENGNGFCMEHWISRDLEPGSPIFYDDAVRPVPSCGAVACIGGTIDLLLGKPCDLDRSCHLLGLNESHMDSLFYGYPSSASDRLYEWPQSFGSEFLSAFTPAEKEQVAERMVLEAMRTKGECFRDCTEGD